ncbi:hypothetical protein M885DRAFT_621430 [Pelagophyceae sp. CCMP2097]|nr:hypothetical protein M885DRAFT_621430 [Pelagophyceae sp. CCMP2097]
MYSPPPRRPGEAGSNGDGQRQRLRMTLPEGVSPLRLLAFEGYNDANELRAAERNEGPPAAHKSRSKSKCTVVVRQCADLPWKQVLALAKGWSGLSWNSMGTKCGQANYSCATHLNCPVLLRVKTDGADGATIFSNDVRHSEDFSTEPHKGMGVGGEFKEEISTLSSAGHFGAMGVYLKLQLKYGTNPLTRDPAKYARIPTKDEIRSFLASNCSASSTLFSNADLLARAFKHRKKPVNTPSRTPPHWRIV